MMPTVQIDRDKDAAAEFLHEITRGWADLPEEPVIELRCLAESKVPNFAHFTPTERGFGELIDHAVAMNGYGRNIYPIINPVRRSSVSPRKSAKDGDILAAYFFWADADDEAAAYAIRNFAGPKPTMAVLTGRTPFDRPHIYWRIADGPTYDLKEWTTIQKGIAAQLSTDETVVNPSRLMRLPGMVNWPTKEKMEKRGRVPELALLRTSFKDERPPVRLERMQRIFGGPQRPTEASSQTKFEIDTMTPGVDREEARTAALSGQEWHNNMIRLVASYVGKGLSDAEIHGLTDSLTLGGYTADETREEVQKAIDGARAKGWTPPPEPDPFKPEPISSRSVAGSESSGTEDTPVTWPTLLSTFDESAMPVRRWVYGYDYIRGFVSVVASAGGIGKTSNALVEALCIVTKRPLLKVDVKEKTKVWVINLEDPRDEIVMRTLAAMKHYGIKPDDVRGNLFLDGEDTLQITLAAEIKGEVKLNTQLVEAMRDKILAEGIGVVIVDPFVSTHLVNENSNSGIQAVVALLRTLARDTGASICIVHHTRKANGQEADIDSVRGAGSLIGAARAARVINRLNMKTAVEIGIPEHEAKHIFRIDDGKANLAPPAENAVYRRMIGVQIDNGEWVGVAVPYELPDEWAGMSEEIVNHMLGQIDRGVDPDNPGAELYSPSRQAKDRWVGTVITTYPFPSAEHTKSAAQAKLILTKWEETGLIEMVDFYSAVQRKDRKGVLSTGRVGANQ